MATSVRHLQAGYRFSGFHSDYEVLSPIGVKGGFGAVYKCKTDGLGQHRAVAVKFLADGEEEWVDRFKREVRILQRHHCGARHDEAGIPPVLDLGQVAVSSSASARFYVMPVIEGPEFPGEGTVVEKLRRVLAVAKRLKRLHDEDEPLVHRDLKPSNILLGSDLKPWLVDFGLAGQAGVDKTVTKTVGLGAGTEGFSAPEQILPDEDGRDLARSPAVDVYSVGALLYYIVLDEMPFPMSKTPVKLYVNEKSLPAHYREGLLKAFRVEQLPDALGHAVYDALQPWPENRAESLHSLIRALEETSGDATSSDGGSFRIELFGLGEAVLDGGDDAASAELASFFDDVRPSVVNDLTPAVSLRSWQRDALRTWSSRATCGIVEAVTGAGKSRLGVEASRVHAEKKGGKAVVVVPTTALLRQWQRRFDLLTPDLRVGRRGGGGEDTLGSADVLVCTIQSLAGVYVPEETLLVADECHRYGGLDAAALADGQRKPGAWARALGSKPWGPRLGLSATVARGDGGHEDILRDVLGEVIYQLSFADVVRLQPVDDPWIAKMKLGFLRVPLGADEREDYDAYNGIMKKKRAQLVAAGCPASPFGAFLACVQEKAAAGNRAAWSYLSNFSKRREMLANSPAKLDAVAELIAAIQAADRTIIFTEMVETASRCFDILTQHGVPAITVTKDTKSKTQVLSRFRRGVYAAIVAPKVLDEGIDVPAADLGIVVCGSRSKRQMIQRLGRVLRPKADGRVARFIFLVLKDTVEDPTAAGGSPEFIDEVRAAQPVDERVFDCNELSAVNAWLADFWASGGHAHFGNAPAGARLYPPTDVSGDLVRLDSEETGLSPQIIEMLELFEEHNEDVLSAAEKSPHRGRNLEALVMRGLEPPFWHIDDEPERTNVTRYVELFGCEQPVVSLRATKNELYARLASRMLIGERPRQQNMESDDVSTEGWYYADDDIDLLRSERDVQRFPKRVQREWPEGFEPDVDPGWNGEHWSEDALWWEMLERASNGEFCKSGDERRQWQREHAHIIEALEDEDDEYAEENDGFSGATLSSYRSGAAVWLDGPEGAVEETIGLFEQHGFRFRHASSRAGSGLPELYLDGRSFKGKKAKAVVNEFEEGGGEASVPGVSA